MYIILRLPVVWETFSRIAVKISFLWDHKHGVYAAASFSANVTSWCSRDTPIFTSIILYINIIFIAQWLFGGNSEILQCSDVFAGIQKLCIQKAISSKHVSPFFYCKNMTSFLNYVSTTLRALFAWQGSIVKCTYACAIIHEENSEYHTLTHLNFRDLFIISYVTNYNYFWIQMIWLNWNEY